MRATIILAGIVSLLGVATAAAAAGTTVDGTTVSDGQTLNFGTTISQSGGDVTGSDGAANTADATADGSSNAAASPVGATVIDKTWLGVVAAIGLATGGLAFGL